MDDVRWLDEQEEAAWRALQRMQMQLEAVLARQLASDSGLSYPDYAVLVALTDQPDGRLRLYELGQELGWEKSRLSHHVTRMVRRGLVAKEKCGDDRRGAYVVVTSAGRTAIESAAPGHLRAVRQHFVDLLSRDELAAVATIAGKVLTELDAAPCDD